MTLTIDDVLDVEHPGTPAWSADGARVAAPVYEDDGQSLRIASAPEFDDVWRLCPGDGHVATFSWAPDPAAGRLALLTDEGELYLVNADHETVERISADVDAGAVVWSGDAQLLATYRDGRPCVFDLEDGDDRRFDVPERGTYLGEEEMLAWSPDDERLAYRFVDREAKQVGVVDVASGELVWRSRETASTHSPAWVADGRLLVDRNDDHGQVREVLAIDVADGETQVLHREEEREHGTVSIGTRTLSPDGERIALALPLDGWEHVYVVDVDSGERAQLTAGEFEDKGVAGSRPQWLDDDTLVFSSNRDGLGERGIYAVTPARTDGTPEVTTLVTGGNNIHPRTSPDGEYLAYVHASRERSPELRVVALDGLDADDGAARVTTSTVDDWSVDPIEPEHVTYESVGGLTVHAYLVDPRESPEVDDDATDLPAVVWVHGGPMRQMRDGWHPERAYAFPYSVHQYLAHKGYVGLFVNYRGGIGYGRAFREALFGNRGDHEMEDVVRGADFLRNLEYVDEGAIGMWGLSYGGYAALQLLGTHPQAFDVAVNLAGLADIELYRDWAEETKYPAVASSQTVRFGGEPWEATEKWEQASPKTHFENYENPLYSFHGTADRYVNFEQLDCVVEELLELDKDHEWEYYPGENHMFSKRATWKRTLTKIEEAFETHLK